MKTPFESLRSCLLAGCLAGVAACGPSNTSEDPGGGTGPTDTCTPGDSYADAEQTCRCTEADTWVCAQELPPGGDLAVAHPIDPRASVLVVVDDSPGMLGAQSRLAQAMQGLAARFEAAEASLLVHVTTADAAQPGFVCQDSPGEGGTFQAASCRERLDRFQPGPGAPADPAAACTDVCDLDGLDLPAGDEGLALLGGRLNVANAGSAGQALACMIPQGNAGCAFSQPLAAAVAALGEGYVDGDASDEEARRGVGAGLVLLTDGTECSVQDPAIFDPGGSRTFWSDPQAATEAVCWNAGVSCKGGPGTYDTCDPARKGVDGDPVGLDAEAALTPSAVLGAELRDGFFGGAEVRALFLAGVPTDYPAAPMVYQDSADPQVQTTYGIAPGCTSADTVAPPPVRLAGAVDGLGASPQEVLRSICLPDYEAPVLELADRLLADVDRERCVTRCPADVFPDEPGLQPVCHATARLFDPADSAAEPDKRAIPACTTSADGWDFPSAEDDLCVRYLTGGDVPPACAEEGWPLAFRVERRDPSGASWRDQVTVTCVPADLDDPQQAEFCSP